MDRPVALTRTSRPTHRGGMVTTDSQRKKARLTGCIVTGCRRDSADAAHLIDRSLTRIGQRDPLAVIGLCRPHHEAYDRGNLDLLPHLELSCRPELAFAVERVGLIPTLRRVTNTRWSPTPEGAVTA